jgi:hypothetical protein
VTTKAKMTDQRILDNYADTLELIARLLRKPGARAIRNAEQWSGMIGSTPADSGPRSSEHNDLARKVAGRTPEYANVHGRLLANIGVLAVISPTIVTDLTFCQEVERVRRQESNRLDRLNSRTGYCEVHYEANATGWCTGTLEHIVLEGFTQVDGRTEHDQIDVCRPCAKSGHKARAASKTGGDEQWDHDAWRSARVARIRAAGGEEVLDGE